MSGEAVRGMCARSLAVAAVLAVLAALAQARPGIPRFTSPSRSPAHLSYARDEEGGRAQVRDGGRGLGGRGGELALRPRGQVHRPLLRVSRLPDRENVQTTHAASARNGVRRTHVSGFNVYTSWEPCLHDVKQILSSSFHRPSIHCFVCSENAHPDRSNCRRKDSGAELFRRNCFFSPVNCRYNLLPSP